MVDLKSVASDLTHPAPPETLKRWGWVSILCVIVACGLWIIAASYAASRNRSDQAMIVFFAGILLMYVPVVTRLLNPEITHHEAVALLIILGLGLYGVNVLRSPTYFSSFDELLHWRTTDDILVTQRLFSPNYLLPVSPFFPGLEIATSALVNLSGLSIYQAGIFVIGAARLVLLLALYLLFERLSRSPRIAGLATVAYMGSSTFVFFDTAFSYESLALPIAIFLTWLMLRSHESNPRTQLIWNGLIILTILALGILHHLTAFLTTAFLALWSVIALLANWRGKREYNPTWMTLLMFVWNLIWLIVMASITVGYLSPYVQDAITALQRILSGQGGDRQLLTLASGSGSINFERIIAFASVAVIGIGLALGIWQWWQKYRQDALAIALGLTALAYPLLPALRLNSSTWETSNRLASTLFIAVAFIVALGFSELPKRWRHSSVRIIIPAFAILFCGGIIAGSSPTTRLPGPYVVSADDRSVEAQGILDAAWAHAMLGINNRMASDRIQSTLMGSYGGQRMVFRQDDNLNISGIFLRFDLGPDELSEMRQARIRYLVVDRRLTTGLPLFGYYFESWENLVVSFIPPINPSMFDKFDHTPNISRIFDSGDIVIYDTGALFDAQ